MQPRHIYASTVSRRDRRWTRRRGRSSAGLAIFALAALIVAVTVTVLASVGPGLS